MRYPWQETAMLVPHASSNVNGPWTAIDNATDYGLVVPALSPSTTVTVQVARDSAGTGGGGLVNQAGTPVLVLASGAGGVCVSSADLAAIKGYPYMRVVLGANQAADVTFYLQQKVVASDVFA